MASDVQNGARDSGPSWWALIDDLPYVAIIVLGLIGISWTSISQTSSTSYWVYVTPIIAVICVIAGWRQAPSGERIAMVVIQVLQWAGVLIAMYLITVTNARQSLEANATDLMLLTLLALGVFVSGLNMRTWKLCATGAFLALAVPMVAWVARAALLLLLIGAALIGLLILSWWFRERSHREA
jgi:hypothetical protein